MIFLIKNFGLAALVLSGLFLMIGCNFSQNENNNQESSFECIGPAEVSEPEGVNFDTVVHPLEKQMIDLGLINVLDADSTLVVEIKYATEDNFVGQDIYQGMDKAYLQPEVAQMLAKAQLLLKKSNPDLSLIVYDAARPRSAQQKMWDSVDATFEEKIKFLSNPSNGSVHNFGAAVDVSIVNKNGQTLDMGTPFDYMGELAYPSLEEELLVRGDLNQEQINNRKLLRSVMIEAGFSAIRTEWWHFNAMSRNLAREKYQIIE